MDDLTKKVVAKAREFAMARVELFEFTHGPLPLESRHCLVATLFTCIMANPMDLVIPEETGLKTVKEDQICFCHYLGQEEAE